MDETASIVDRRNKRLEDARNVYEEVKKGLLAQKESLNSIAKIADVHVYET
jgi:ribosome maturation protein Sdo1